MESKQTVLIIDDEANLVELVKSQLEIHGYSVMAASNGVEGLRVLGKIDFLRISWLYMLTIL